MKWILLIGLVSSLFAQKITLDFGKQLNQHSDKSLSIALGASLVLPGTGEWYLDEKAKASWFWGSELLTWGTLWLSHNYSENQVSKIYNYAIANAKATGLKKDIKTLQELGEYRSRNGGNSLNSNPELGDDYNQDQLRAGLATDESLSNELRWNWGAIGDVNADQHYATYNDLVKNYRRSQMAFQISIGMLALNRLLSLIDVFRIYKQGSGGVSFQVQPGIDYAGAKLAVNF